MTNFEILLAEIGTLLMANDKSLAKPNYIKISGAMARDPEVRKYCRINQNAGDFLSIPVIVVRDVEPIYLTGDQNDPEEKRSLPNAKTTKSSPA